MGCRIHISDEDFSFWEASDISPKLIIDSMRDVVQIFVNGQLAGISLTLILFGYFITERPSFEKKGRKKKNQKTIST